jgi:hypothetical protein
MHGSDPAVRENRVEPTCGQEPDLSDFGKKEGSHFIVDFIATILLHCFS